jgi:hypothetical protein
MPNPTSSNPTPRPLLAWLFICFLALAPAYFLARVLLVTLALLFASPYPGEITVAENQDPKTLRLHFTFNTTSAIKSQSVITGTVHARTASFNRIFPNADPAEKPIPVTIYHFSLGPFFHNSINQLPPYYYDNLYFLLTLGLACSLVPPLVWFLLIEHPRHAPLSRSSS